MRVIIPCWIINESLINLTENTINSIRQADNVEIIIVDNGSPLAGGMLREWADLYIRNKENLGYAKAVNQGLKMCKKGELVAISNNDVRVSSNWKEVAEEVFENKKVASLHYRMTTYDTPIVFGNKTYIEGRERWCTGSFFVMRNKWLFDENYLNSYDDWDIHYRMYKEGYKTAYTTKACYQHMDSFTQKLVTWDREERDKKNREYFKKKHGDYPENCWQEMFPEQMSMDWKSVFDEL